MKTQRILASTLILTISLFSFVFAENEKQVRAERPNRVEKQIANLTEALQLSSEQVEQITPIVKEQTEQQKKNRELYQGDREKMREAGKTLQEETDKKIMALLTPEQVELYKKYKEEQQKKMSERRQQGQGRRANRN